MKTNKTKCSECGKNVGKLWLSNAVVTNDEAEVNGQKELDSDHEMRNEAKMNAGSKCRRRLESEVGSKDDEPRKKEKERKIG